ncbi:ATP-binding protein [Streptomyces sp. XM4193]|uniref:ATP-binding protein n=1 Tax=Streptomyces sp. XM4193 TaxID=2929782 RepID=UPI001FF9494B|nr:ATP-binding protein [Streptomyces sp. XM4193]MCK1797592.1 ATP-binding protein [Streptomyces sp. XM4193]
MSTTAQPPRSAAPFPHQGASLGDGVRPDGDVTRASCCLAATTEAPPFLRTFARGVARRWRLEADVEDALAVIVTELVTNAVLHSGSPEVSLRLGLDGTTLSIEVRDSGRWRPREAPRREPLDEGAACGRGLTLVAAYASSTRAHPSPQGTTVVADLSVPPTRRGSGGRSPNGRVNPRRRTAAGVG